MQGPLPDNTQHLQETDILAPTGFELAVPANKRPQTHALDHMATGIGFVCLILCVNTVCAVKLVFIECTLRLLESEFY